MLCLSRVSTFKVGCNVSLWHLYAPLVVKPFLPLFDRKRSNCITQLRIITRNVFAFTSNEWERAKLTGLETSETNLNWIGIIFCLQSDRVRENYKMFLIGVHYIVLQLNYTMILNVQY